MRYIALACDYDGTIADHGVVSPATLDALRRLRGSGRRVILVTGRALDDLRDVAPDLHCFDRVVAENGAVLVRPESGKVVELGAPPPEAFVAALRARDVPLTTGRVVVATVEPWESIVLETIRAQGLELQVVFNKGAVMILPSGVNKATGLAAALAELGVSAHSVVGVGDAENDHALLQGCECAVAVAGALPALRERVDWVTPADAGAGVVQLVERLLQDDLRSLAPQLARHRIPIGETPVGAAVTLEPWGETVLLAGSSGGGKTTLATAALEQLIARGYQCCIVDPEGDYADVPGTVTLGDADHEPVVDEVLALLAAPDRHAVVSLVGVALEQRPAWFQEFLPQVQALRARTGHPAWVLVDEAHHLLPASWEPTSVTLPQALTGLLLVTVHPDRVAAAALQATDVVVAVGNAPMAALGAAARALGRPCPADGLDTAEAVLWRWRDDDAPVGFRVTPPRTAQRRHRRKYAEGTLPPDRSFWFRGPEGALNLRAQNLFLFLQIADGVDDATWLHHLHAGDVARWFAEAIKDPELGDDARAVADDASLDPRTSRDRIREAVLRRYTLPA